MKLVRQRGQHLVGPRITRDQLGERPSGLGGDVREWGQWTRRKERVAGTLEDAHVCRVRAESADEGCLADPGLSHDEDEPSGSTLDLPLGLAKGGEERLTLE